MYYGAFQARHSLNMLGETKTVPVLLYEFYLDSVSATLYFDFCFEYSFPVFLAINLEKLQHKSRRHTKWCYPGVESRFFTIGLTFERLGQEVHGMRFLLLQMLATLSSHLLLSLSPGVFSPLPGCVLVPFCLCKWGDATAYPALG